MYKLDIYDLLTGMADAIQRNIDFCPDRDKFQKLWFEVLPYESDISGYEPLSTENFIITHIGDGEWVFYYTGQHLEEYEEHYDIPLVIGWYKYPLRSVWSSRNITLSEFRKILTKYKEECKEAGLL